jgi:hypothetical protein
MFDAMRPRSDDILVCRRVRGPRVVYILRPVKGPDQIVVPSLEVAIEQAMSVAARRHVRVWLTSDGQHHVPVEEGFPSQLLGRAGDAGPGQAPACA